MRARLFFAVVAIGAIGGSAFAAKTITVAQRGLMLNVSSLTIAKGDRIVFENQDDVIHNIHIFGPGEDEDSDLGLQKPGVPLTYKFDKDGLFKVRCNIHPSVKMSVTVK
jgi:plastocyanin